MTRLELALRALTAIFVLSALGALLWRPATGALRAPDADFDAAPAPSVAVAAADPATTESIIAANIFSPSRTPPAARYQPLAIGDDAAAAEVANAAPADATMVDAEDAVPRLYGVIAGPHGRAALLRLDPDAPDAQLLREGESSGSYRVVRINEQSVVLTGPAGRVELRLIRPEG